MYNFYKIITKPDKRYFGFDIIRAFSVLLVITMHFVQQSCFLTGTNYFALPLPDPVDMFFVCSGFLIGYHFIIDMHKVEKVDLKFTSHFLIMRWGRTLPAYYIVLIFLVLLHAIISRKLNIPILNFFFLQNFISNKSTFYRETWTISVEEWFYLLFPLLFMIIAKVLKLSKDRTYLIVLFCLIFGSIFLKVYYYLYVFKNHTFIDWANHFREIVVLRLDTIAIGLLAAYVCYHHEDIWTKYRYKVLLFAVPIYVFSIFYYWAWSNELLRIEAPMIKHPVPWRFHFAGTSFSTFYHYTLFYFISPISLALCLPFLKSLKYKPTRLNNFIMYTSFISYSIFLLHISVVLKLFILVYLLGVKNFVVLYFLWLIATYLFSHFYYLKVELPFMNKRNWVLEKFNLGKHSRS